MLHVKLTLSVIALLTTPVLRAQTAETTQLPVTPVIKVEASGAEANKMLASWLLAACNNEVALARIAERRAQEAKVKQFAQQMFAEHAKLVVQLQRFAGIETRISDETRVADEQRPVSTGQEREPIEATSDRWSTENGQFNHLALIRDLCRRCLQVETKLLETRSDADFDRSFLQAQVGLHNQAIIMAEVFRNYATGDLRQTLAQAAKTLRAHLLQVQQLCQECDREAQKPKPMPKQK